MQRVAILEAERATKGSSLAPGARSVYDPAPGAELCEAMVAMLLL